MTQYPLWLHTDLTEAAGGGVAVPFGWAGCSAYVTNQIDEGATSRVLYVTDSGYGGDIHEIRNQVGTVQGGSWIPVNWMRDADLSLLLTNYSGGFQAQAQAFGYQTPDGTARVVFIGLDNWIHEFKLEADGWTVANLSAIAGMTQVPQPGQVIGGSLFPVQPWSVPSPYFSSPDDHARVVYGATDAHVRELSLHTTNPNSAWIDADLTALAIAGGWDAPDTANKPFGYLGGDSVPRVIYNDLDSGGVQELRLGSSGWICANIGALANAPPSYGGGSGGFVIDTSAYVTPDAIARVVYLGDDGNAHELMLANDRSPWIHTDLTSRSGAQTTPNTMLYGCCGSDNVPRAVYLGLDSHVHQFSYENGNWSDEDLFPLVFNPPSGGMATTAAFGSVPYAYVFNGLPQIVYIGPDQHLHLLAPFLAYQQVRRMDSVWAVNLQRAIARTRR
jgi:hypothetical protein